MIEVLIALILLAVGILAIASLQITSVRGNFFSHNLMQATYAAQDRLEFLKNLPIDHLSLATGNHDDGTKSIPDSDMVFNCSYSVEPFPPDGNYLIKYLVRWNDGKDHSLSFSTIRSQ